MSVTLQDIFDDLKYGELSQYSFSGSIDGGVGISEEDYPALISHINRALTALHTRFVLKERELTLDLNEVISFYILDSKYAYSNLESDEPVKYINDFSRPFTDDLLKVRSAFTDRGLPVPINDDTETSGGIWLLDYRTLQVSFPSDNTALFVQYQANHDPIEPEVTDPSSVVIDIPEYCIEPLLAYVTYRVFNASADQEQRLVANEYRMRYDQMCADIERYNVIGNDPNNTNTKLYQRGFV